MKKYQLVIFLGIVHFLNDCISGLIVGRAAGTKDVLTTGLFVMVYNVLAFGIQPVWGVLGDYLRNYKYVTLTGMILVILSLFTIEFNILVSIILAGLGSSAFHAGGGGLTLLTAGESSKFAGIFASPGVLGLGTGALMVHFGIFPVVPLIILLIAAAAFLMLYFRQTEIVEISMQRDIEEFEMHDFVMIMMLMIIAFNSLVWNLLNIFNAGDYAGLVIIAYAAGAGKLFGGYASEYIGYKRYLMGALITAVPFLMLGKLNIVFAAIGAFFLQSTIPLYVTTLYRFTVNKPGFSASLSFGFMIAVAGLPVFIFSRAFLNQYFMYAVPLLIIALVILIRKIPEARQGGLTGKRSALS